MSRFIHCEQYPNKWQGSGKMSIDPTQVSYIEHVKTYVMDDRSKGHTKIHTIYGSIIEIDESPKEVEDKINAWYDERDKENVNSITISKDDLFRNFLLRNMSQ